MSPERRVSWPTSSGPAPPEQARRGRAPEREGQRRLEVDVGDAADAVRAEQAGHGGASARRRRRRVAAAIDARLGPADGRDGWPGAIGRLGHGDGRPARVARRDRHQVQAIERLDHHVHLMRAGSQPAHRDMRIDGRRVERHRGQAGRPARVTRTVGVDSDVLARRHGRPAAWTPPARCGSPTSGSTVTTSRTPGPATRLTSAGRSASTVRATSPVSAGDVQRLGRDGRQPLDRRRLAAHGHGLGVGTDAAHPIAGCRRAR